MKNTVKYLTQVEADHFDTLDQQNTLGWVLQFSILADIHRDTFHT